MFSDITTPKKFVGLHAHSIYINKMNERVNHEYC